MWMWMSWCPIWFLFCYVCPLLQGPCGAVRAWGQLLASDAFHVTYWNQHFDWPWLKAALLANQLSPLQARARARAIWCDWLSPSRSTQGVKPSEGGLPPIFRPFLVAMPSHYNLVNSTRKQSFSILVCTWISTRAHDCIFDVYLCPPTIEQVL